MQLSNFLQETIGTWGDKKWNLVQLSLSTTFKKMSKDIIPYSPSAVFYCLIFYFKCMSTEVAHAPSLYLPFFYLASDHPLEIYLIKRASLPELWYNEYCSS